MNKTAKSQNTSGLTQTRTWRTIKGSKTRCSEHMKCETGFAELGSVPLKIDRKVPDVLHSKTLQKWAGLAIRIRRTDQLRNLGSTIRRVSNELPEKIEKIYAECEGRCQMKIDSECQKLYYREFSRMAQGFAVLQYWEIEILVGKLQLAGGVSDSELQRITSEKLQQASNCSPAGKPVGVFDFERFIYLLVEVIKEVRELQNAKTPAWSLRDLLPLDPHGKKAYWDLLIFGLIFYCCFEVRQIIYCC